GEPERARPLRRRRPELVRLRGELEPVGDHEDAVAHLLLVEVVALAPQDLAEEIRERRMRVDERLTGVEEDRADRHARMIPAPIRAVLSRPGRRGRRPAPAPFVRGRARAGRPEPPAPGSFLRYRGSRRRRRRARRRRLARPSAPGRPTRTSRAVPRRAGAAPPPATRPRRPRRT